MCKLIIRLFLFIVVSLSFGQSIDIVNVQKEAGLLDSFFQVNDGSYITNIESRNTLFINQVGLNKEAFVKVTSLQSNVDVSQFGRDN